MRTVAGINYEIPNELHHRAKIAAAIEGVSLKAFLITALEQAVETAENDPRQPPKASI